MDMGFPHHIELDYVIDSTTEDKGMKGGKGGGGERGCKGGVVSGTG